jgi:DnaJ-class molecular chaperone
MTSSVAVIIQELGGSRYLLQCARCNGTGRYIHDTIYACETCNGRGAVLVEVVAGSLPFVKCARCNGTGRYIHNTSSASDSCQGVGAQPAAGQMRVIK